MGSTRGDIGRPPKLTYLSMDPLSSTVGSSQVFAYVERLARRGLGVDLVTFEHSVDLGLLEKLSVLGVTNITKPFGLRSSST